MLYQGEHKNVLLYSKKTISNIIISFTIATTGCGVGFSNKNTIPKEQENQEPKVQVEVDEGKSDLVLTGADPFHYQAEIKWPKNIENVSVYLNGALSFKSPSQQVTNCFLGLDHNQEYKIQVFRTPLSKKDGVESISPVATPTALASPLPSLIPSTEDQTLVAEWTIKTPLDISVSRLSPFFGFEIPWDLKAHRTFIDEEIPVVTNGFALKIDTDELIILKNNQADNNQELKFNPNHTAMEDAASIETFTTEGINHRYPPSSLGLSPEFWIDGKDGGLITIKAKIAVGRLNVFLRGQNGADGYNGTPYADDDRAPSGADGFPADYADCSNFSGGVRNICTCKKDTEANENGHKGHKGDRGRPGGNGGRGGDTGSIKIEVAELSPTFHVSIISEIGVSGTPGKAGPPQKGGFSGRKMEPKQIREINPFVDLVCKEPIDEGEGELGDKGIDGVKQRNGIIEQNCFSTGEGFGRCAN